MKHDTSLTPAIGGPLNTIAREQAHALPLGSETDERFELRRRGQAVKKKRCIARTLYDRTGERDGRDGVNIWRNEFRALKEFRRLSCLSGGSPLGAAMLSGLPAGKLITSAPATTSAFTSSGRSRDEGSVMELDRRGCVVQPRSWANR
jgi:hypothetical protein